MRYVMAMLSAALLLTGTSFSQTAGLIEGTVLDYNGSPVAAATVYAHPMGVVMHSIVPHSLTDTAGHYSVKVRFGRFALAAGKPEDDYPDALNYTFYFGFQQAPEVELTALHDRAVVDLRLGKKAGILLGTVQDASRGNPLHANVEFRWISDPRIFLSGSGLTNAQFRILVPSDTPLSMVVSQTGNEDWFYASETQQGKSTAIVLHPGESLNLEIKLRRKSSSGAR